jgi:hypothetical protein
MPVLLLPPGTVQVVLGGIVPQVIAIKLALSVVASALLVQRVMKNERPVPVAAGSLSIDDAAAAADDAAPANEPVNEPNNQAAAEEQEAASTAVLANVTAPTVQVPAILGQVEIRRAPAVVLPPTPPVVSDAINVFLPPAGLPPRVPPRGAQAIFVEDGHPKKKASEDVVPACAARTIASAGARTVDAKPGYAFSPAPTIAAAAATSRMVEKKSGPVMMSPEAPAESTSVVPPIGCEPVPVCSSSGSESSSSPTTPTSVQAYDHRLVEPATVSNPRDGAPPAAAGGLASSVQQLQQQQRGVAEESSSPTPNPPPQVRPQGDLVDARNPSEASDATSDEESNANDSTSVANLFPAGTAAPAMTAAPPALQLRGAFAPRPEPRYNSGCEYTKYRRDAESDDDTDAESVDEEVDYSDPQDDQPYLFGANVLPEGYAVLGKRKFDSESDEYAAADPESIQGPEDSSAPAAAAAAKEEEEVEHLPPSKRRRKSPPASSTTHAAAAAPTAVAATEAPQAKPKASKKTSPRPSAAPKRCSAAPKRCSAPPKRSSARARVATAAAAAVAKPSSKVVAAKVAEVDKKQTKNPRVSAAAAKRRGAAVPAAATTAPAPSPKPATKKGVATPRASAKRTRATSSELELVEADAQQPQPSKKARRTK